MCPQHAIRVEAIATMVEAIAIGVEAIAIGVEAIAIRVEKPLSNGVSFHSECTGRMLLLLAFRIQF